MDVFVARAKELCVLKAGGIPAVGKVKYRVSGKVPNRKLRADYESGFAFEIVEGGPQSTPRVVARPQPSAAEAVEE